MGNADLQDKVAYFQLQDLLELSEDENEYPDPGLFAAERLLAGPSPVLPPTLVRRGSSFLGPTPRERQREFEGHAALHRAVGRERDTGLTRSSTATEPSAQSFPVAAFKQRHGAPKRLLKKTASMSDLAAKDHIPFYKRKGEIPRELKHANAKVANNITIEPEHRQLLKERIVYLFPNNDISMARRLRLHKIIQLGAAWVTNWREDITHVIFDDDRHTYAQLLRHLKIVSLPVSSSPNHAVPAKGVEGQCRRREIRSIHTAVHTVLSTTGCFKSKISGQRGPACKRVANAGTSGVL